jgi:HlyD family secretion protein
LETDKPILPLDTITVTEDVFIMKNTFSDHGNEMEEIISKKPPFIVRWGTVFFFFLLLLIGLIFWFIQYPDIVVAKAKLTSLNAPKAIVTKSEGQLVKLTAKEGDMVHKDEVIGYMESTANPETVLHLSVKLDSLQHLLTNNQGNILSFFFPFGEGRDGALGELQQPYQTFIQSFISFRSYLESGFYLQK